MTPKTKQQIEDGLSEYKYHIQQAHKALGALIDNNAELNTPDTVAVWLILEGLLSDIGRINTSFWDIDGVVE